MSPQRGARGSGYVHDVLILTDLSFTITSARSTRLSTLLYIAEMSFRQGDQQQEQETRHLSQSRHTCAHCQKLVIDPTKPISPANRAGKSWTEIRNTFKYTVAELLQAGKDSCPIFERIVTRGIEYDSWSVSSNNNRSVDVHFDLITSMTPLNVTKVKVICHWTDTDEGLMNSEGIKQNTYSVEAESGMCAVEVGCFSPSHFMI